MAKIFLDREFAKEIAKLNGNGNTMDNKGLLDDQYERIEID